MTLARYAEDRAREAWEARIKHVRASNAWAEIADERPERRAVYEILARWMPHTACVRCAKAGE